MERLLTPQGLVVEESPSKRKALPVGFDFHASVSVTGSAARRAVTELPAGGAVMVRTLPGRGARRPVHESSFGVVLRGEGPNTLDPFQTK